MTDIVERIKDAETATHALFNYIFQDAREEIERLRAKIAEIEEPEPARLVTPSAPDGWETDLLIVEHAMRMNNWDRNSDTSDDLKRSAYKIISKLLAAPEAKP